MSPSTRQRHRRRGSSGAWVFGILVVVLVLYGVFASQLFPRGAEPEPTATTATAAEPTPSATPPVTPEPAQLGLEGVIDGTTVIEDGPFTLETDEDELSTVIEQGLNANGTPVDDFDVALVDESDGGLMTFETVLSDGGVPLSGEIALFVVDGRLEAEVTDARMAGVPLPGFARDVVNDVVQQATAFGDDLANEGVTITDLETEDGRLRIVGQKA